MSTFLTTAILALMLGAPGAGSAEKPRYWGKVADGSNRGRIQYKGQSYTVRAGDEIPGWGKVRAVTEGYLVVRRTLDDAEKQAREAAGLLVVDVQDVRIPNGARTLAGGTSTPTPR